MPDIADLIPAGKKLATVDDETNRLNEPTMEAIQQDLIPTFVTFKNFDGTPVVGKNVVITLTEDESDIQDITVEEL